MADETFGFVPLEEQPTDTPPSDDFGFIPIEEYEAQQTGVDGAIKASPDNQNFMQLVATGANAAWNDLVGKASKPGDLIDNVNQAGLGLQQGLYNIGQAGWGTIASLPIPGLSQYAKDLAEISDDEIRSIEGESERIGGGQLTKDLVGMATSSLPAVGVGLGAGVAVRASGLGAKIAGATGITTTAVASGAQTYGQSFAEDVTRKLSEGKTFDEAKTESYIPALAKGAGTAVVTALGARYGIEAPLSTLFKEGGEAVAKKTFSGFLKALGKGAISEAPEEMADQAWQGAVDVMNKNPNVSVQDAFTNSFQAGLMAPFLGGPMQGLTYLSSEKTPEQLLDFKKKLDQKTSQNIVAQNAAQVGLPATAAAIQQQARSVDEEDSDLEAGLAGLAQQAEAENAPIDPAIAAVAPATAQALAEQQPVTEIPATEPNGETAGEVTPPQNLEGVPVEPIESFMARTKDPARRTEFSKDLTQRRESIEKSQPDSVELPIIKQTEERIQVAEQAAALGLLDLDAATGKIMADLGTKLDSLPVATTAEPVALQPEQPAIVESATENVAAPIVESSPEIPKAIEPEELTPNDQVEIEQELAEEQDLPTSEDIPVIDSDPESMGRIAQQQIDSRDQGYIDALPEVAKIKDTRALKPESQRAYNANFGKLFYDLSAPQLKEMEDAYVRESGILRAMADNPNRGYSWVNAATKENAINFSTYESLQRYRRWITEHGSINAVDGKGKRFSASMVGAFASKTMAQQNKLAATGNSISIENIMSYDQAADRRVNAQEQPSEEEPVAGEYQLDEGPDAVTVGDEQASDAVGTEESGGDFAPAPDVVEELDSEREAAQAKYATVRGATESYLRSVPSADRNAASHVINDFMQGDFFPTKSVERPEISLDPKFIMRIKAELGSHLKEASMLGTLAASDIASPRAGNPVIGRKLAQDLGMDGTLEKALKTIINGRRLNVNYRDIAELLLNNPLSKQLRLVSVYNETLPYAGAARPGVVEINLGVPHFKDSPELTLIHETIHEVLHGVEKASDEELSQAQREARSQLRNVFEAMREKVGAELKVAPESFQDGGWYQHGRTYYGLSNFSEFLTEAMTNPEFQALMKKHHDDAANPKLNLWQKFVHMVTRLVANKSLAPLSSHQQIVDRIIDLIKQPVSVQLQEDYILQDLLSPMRSIREDVLAQREFLIDKGRSLGYRDVNTFALEKPSEFRRAANEWRERNAAYANAFNRGESDTPRYSVKDEEKNNEYASAGVPIQDHAGNIEGVRRILEPARRAAQARPIAERILNQIISRFPESRVARFSRTLGTSRSTPAQGYFERLIDQVKGKERIRIERELAYGSEVNNDRKNGGINQVIDLAAATLDPTLTYDQIRDPKTWGLTLPEAKYSPMSQPRKADETNPLYNEKSKADPISGKPSYIYQNSRIFFTQGVSASEPQRRRASAGREAARKIAARGARGLDADVELVDALRYSDEQFSSAVKDGLINPEEAKALLEMRKDFPRVTSEKIGTLIGQPKYAELLELISRYNKDESGMEAFVDSLQPIEDYIENISVPAELQKYRDQIIKDMLISRIEIENADGLRAYLDNMMRGLFITQSPSASWKFISMGSEAAAFKDNKNQAIYKIFPNRGNGSVGLRPASIEDGPLYRGQYPNREMTFGIDPESMASDGVKNIIQVDTEKFRLIGTERVPVSELLQGDKNKFYGFIHQEVVAITPTGDLILKQPEAKGQKITDNEVKTWAERMGYVPLPELASERLIADARRQPVLMRAEDGQYAVALDMRPANGKYDPATGEVMIFDPMIRPLVEEDFAKSYTLQEGRAQYEGQHGKPESLFQRNASGAAVPVSRRTIKQSPRADIDTSAKDRGLSNDQAQQQLGELLRRFSLSARADAFSRQLGVSVRAGLAFAAKGQVKFDRLGNVSIQINPVTYSKELAENKIEAETRQDIEDTLDEEAIHAAHIISVRDRWDRASGIGFDNFFNQEMQSILTEAQQSKDPIIRQAFSDGMNLYYGNPRSASGQFTTPQGVFNFINSDPRRLAVAVPEIVRQLVQARQAGSVTETRSLALIDRLVAWVRSALNSLKKVASQNTPSLLNRAITETEAVLSGNPRGLPINQQEVNDPAGAFNSADIRQHNFNERIRSTEGFESMPERFYDKLFNDDLNAEANSEFLNDDNLDRTVTRIVGGTGLREDLRNVMAMQALLRLREVETVARAAGDAASARVSMEQQTQVMDALLASNLQQGRAIQAMVMWTRLTPEGRVYKVTRDFDRDQKNVLSKNPDLMKAAREMAGLANGAINEAIQANEKVMVDAERLNRARAIKQGRADVVSVPQAVNEFFTTDTGSLSLKQYLQQKTALLDSDATLVEKAITKTVKKPNATDKIYGNIKLQLKPEQFSIFQKAVDYALKKGKITGDGLQDIMAETLGLPNLNQEEKSKLQKLASEINLFPIDPNGVDSIQRSDANRRFLNYVQELTKDSPGEVWNLIWQMQALSGPQTQAVNLLGNTFLMASRLLLEEQMVYTGSAWKQLGAIRGSVEGSKAFAGTLASLVRGLTTQGWTEAASVINTGYGGRYAANLGEVTYLNWFERVAERPTNSSAALEIRKKYAQFGAIVFRLMSGGDALAFYGTKAGKSYLEARYKGMSQGLSGAQLESFVAETAGLTPESKIRAINQAEQEAADGQFKKGSMQYRRRVEQLIDSDLTDDIRESAVDLAGRLTLTSQPKGLLGVIVDGFGMMSANAPFLKSFMPFLNTAANLTNITLEYFPVVSMARGIGLTDKIFHDKWKDRYSITPANERDRMTIFARGFIGTATMIAIYGMAKGASDDDEENPWLEISAGGPKDKAARDMFYASGRKPYTISVRGSDGKRVSFDYRFTPLLMALGPIGAIMDAQRYQKNLDEKSASDVAAILSMGIVKTMLDQTFYAGMMRLNESLAGATSSPDQFAASVAQTFAGYVPGNAAIIRFFDNLANPTIKDRSDLGASILANTPVVRNLGNDKLNAFGESVIKTRQDIVAGRFLPTNSQKVPELYQVLASKGAWPTYPDTSSKLGSKPMTEAQVYDWIKVSGPPLREYLDKNLERIKEMSPEQAQDFVRDKSSALRKQYKTRLFGQEIQR